MGVTTETISLMQMTQRTVLPDEPREPPVFLSREERVRRFKLDVGVESLHWHDWCARRPRAGASTGGARSVWSAGGSSGLPRVLLC
jgi:hypothetical protein